MKFVFGAMCFCFVSVSCITPQDDISLLYRTLDALTRGLHYMQRVISEMNIDGVFCVRRVEEQLQAFLEFQPGVFKSIRYWVDGLRIRAKRIANKGRDVIYKNEPINAKALGFLLSQSKKLIWYPSLSTSTNATVEPVPCVDSVFNGPFSDMCFSQLSKTDNVSNGCSISPPCMLHNQDMRQRGYIITHQVLFWEMMEARNCVNQVSRQLREDFCSNVMRDAKQAERLNFPLTYRDLFMEQIGLCGIWGFRDFHNPEWLKKIFKWQLPSGCYNNPAIYNCEDDLNLVIHSREKRTERLLSDGCLAHKTGVALLALVASLRFEAERIFSATPLTNDLVKNSV